MAKLENFIYPTQTVGSLAGSLAWGFFVARCLQPSGNPRSCRQETEAFVWRPPTWPMLQIGRLTLAPTPSNVLIAFTDYEI